MVLPLLVLAEIAVFLSCFDREGFTSSRVKKPDAYLLDIERMNGTDLHTLELREGDVLQIQFETERCFYFFPIEVLAYKLLKKPINKVQFKAKNRFL